MKTETWKTAGGQSIFARIWPAPQESKGLIIQCHGLGEHSGRYAHVAKWFNEHGWSFLGYDHAGHGKNKGTRGHIPSYEALMQELDTAIQKGQEAFPGQKIWIYGHSWGGNMVLNYLIRRQPSITGAIVTGPWLTLPPKLEPNAFLKGMANIMKSIWPAMQQGNGLDVKGISHDPEVVKAYEADPLVHNKITVRNFVESNQAAAHALQNAAGVNVPLYLAHGGGDFLTNPEGSKQFASGINRDDFKFKIWPDWYHELHNEPGKDSFFKDVLKFIESY